MGLQNTVVSLRLDGRAHRLRRARARRRLERGLRDGGPGPGHGAWRCWRRCSTTRRGARPIATARTCRRDVTFNKHSDRSDWMSNVIEGRAVRAWRASSPSRPRSPSPTRRAARCAIAASTSRTSSAACRTRRSGACSSTARFEPGPGAGRAAPADDPQRRPARRRAGGDRRAGAGVGPAAADRHHRRAGAQRPRPRVGHGAELRRPERARARQALGPAGRDRPGRARWPSAS